MQFTQRRKHFVIGLVVLMFVVSGAYSSDAQTLRVGFFTIEPHTIVESPGNNGGAAVEYFLQLTKAMGIDDVRFQELPLARLVEELEKDMLDAILFLAKNPERESLFRYPDAPYYMGQSGVAVAASSSLQSISAIDDLLPLRIGMLARGYLSPFMQDERLKFDPVSGNTPILQNLKKLVAGRVDAVYVPDLAVIQFEAYRNGYDDTQVRFCRFRNLPPRIIQCVFFSAARRCIFPSMKKPCKNWKKTLPYEQFLQEYIAHASPE